VTPVTAVTPVLALRSVSKHYPGCSMIDGLEVVKAQ
jgi:hypothetical protein